MTESDEKSDDDLDGRAMNMSDVFGGSEPGPETTASDESMEAEASAASETVETPETSEPSEASESESNSTGVTESETSESSPPMSASSASQTSHPNTESIQEDASSMIPLTESEGADSIVAEPTQSKVARERHGVQFYLTEDLYTREERVYDQLNQLYKHKFGTELEKNRQYRQELVALALEHSDELRERLNIADVDPSEVFDLL